MTERRRRLLGALKVVFALALLAWVASGLPWKDVLEWHAGETTLEVEGTLVGDWQGSHVGFEVSADAPELAEAWPAELRVAQRAGQPLTQLERRQVDVEGAEGYDWRPGMPRVFQGLTAFGYASALAALLVGALFGVTRWWRLLALARCPSSWLNTLRLTLLGLFFNLVFPGLTGGDVPKALLVVREHPERRADALATVVIDRLVGLWGLLGLAAVVSWFGGERFEAIFLAVNGVFAAATLGMLFLLFPGPRRALGLDRLVDRLPGAARLRKLEQAALVYSGRPLELLLACALSVLNHVCVITAIYLLGRDLGDGLGFGAYFGIVPVANVVTALPLSPGGWGVGDWLYGELFELFGGSLAMGVAVSVTFRLCNVTFSLIGGLCLFLPGGRVTRSEVRELEELAEVE